MTDLLAVLKELDAARTPGEWSIEYGGPEPSWRITSDVIDVLGDLGNADSAKVDGDWIAACSTAVPLLIEVAEAARNEHDEKCGCEGEACEVGAVLAALNASDTPGKGQ